MLIIVILKENSMSYHILTELHIPYPHNEALAESHQNIQTRSRGLMTVQVIRAMMIHLTLILAQPLVLKADKKGNYRGRTEVCVNTDILRIYLNQHYFNSFQRFLKHE